MSDFCDFSFVWNLESVLGEQDEGVHSRRRGTGYVFVCVSVIVFKYYIFTLLGLRERGYFLFVCCSEAASFFSFKAACSLKFFENLQRVLSEFRITNKDNVFIGGDFNCPLNPLLDKEGGIYFCLHVLRLFEQLKC